MTRDLPPVTIQSDSLGAQISPRGAELVVLRDAQGRDLLSDGDPAFWRGKAPILFPIVGMLNGGRYRLGEQIFEMPKHGFARRRDFAVVTHDEGSATFRLEADEATLAVYPFRFRLDMGFAIKGACLTMTASIANLGDGPMPTSFGFHPALRWPLPYGQARSGHYLTFAEPEPAPIRRIDEAGVVCPDTPPTPVEGRTLSLRDALFEDDAIIFDRLASSSLTYGADTGPKLQVDFPGAEYLGVWTKPGAAFICIEPWWGIADPQGYDGDFRNKPGVFEVAPGDTRHLAMSISLTGA